jgi:hypothetical protein
MRRRVTAPDDTRSPAAGTDVAPRSAGRAAGLPSTRANLRTRSRRLPDRACGTPDCPSRDGRSRRRALSSPRHQRRPWMPVARGSAATRDSHQAGNVCLRKGGRVATRLLTIERAVRATGLPSRTIHRADSRRPPPRHEAYLEGWLESTRGSPKYARRRTGYPSQQPACSPRRRADDPDAAHPRAAADGVRARVRASRGRRLPGERSPGDPARWHGRVSRPWRERGRGTAQRSQTFDLEDDARDFDGARAAAQADRRDPALLADEITLCETSSVSGR